MKFEPNKIVKGIVTSIESYGFWFEVQKVKGVVKLTKITWEPGFVEVAEYVKVGSEVEVKVLAYDGDTIYASLRDVNPELNPWRNPPR